jgi:hypothetical protein
VRVGGGGGGGGGGVVGGGGGLVGRRRELPRATTRSCPFYTTAYHFIIFFTYFIIVIYYYYIILVPNLHNSIKQIIQLLFHIKQIIIQLLYYIKQIIQLLFNSSLRSVFIPSSPENCLPLPPPSLPPLFSGFFFSARCLSSVYGDYIEMQMVVRGGVGPPARRSEKMAEALVAVVKEHAQMKVVFLVCKFF